MGRRAIRVIILAISLLATGPAAHVGRATPVDIVDASDPGRRQATLMDFKTWIITRPDLAATGYLESVDYPATLSTTILWHGDPAPQPAIAAEGARRGIAVTFQPRRYGLPRLTAAIRTIGTRSWNGFAISGVSARRADFDGITVEGAWPMGPPPPASALAGLAATATAATGVAVRFQIAGPTALTSTTRSTDVAPLNAGGQMYSPTRNDFCSSGFAIRDAAGRTHTTTARHCRSGDYRAADGTTRYGATVAISGAGAARELSTTGFYWMFDGAAARKTVTGYGDVSLGDRVCVSGAMSGTHCGVEIIDTLYQLTDGPGPNSAFYAIRGVQLALGAIATARGDSGGPVLVTAGAGKVHAVGMIQAGRNDVPGPSGACPPGGVRVATTTCYTDVFFTSMRTVVNTLSGASLVTGP